MTSFYVDGSIAQSGNGASWASAWKTFDAINYGALRPGDVVFISGGGSGLVYTQPLTVRASGAAGQRIRFIRATEAGRNGPVTIEGKNAIPKGVVVSGFNHVGIENLGVKNCTEAGIKITSAIGVLASGCSIYALSRGVDMWRTNGAIVQGNVVTGPTQDNRQNDGIFSAECVGNSYLDNRITITNEGTEHNDGIQSYWDKDLIIADNYIEQKNKKTIDAQGIFITRPTGKMTVTGNTVIGLSTQNSLITLKNLSGSTGTLYAASNKLIGSKWGLAHIEYSPGSTIVDNLLYSTSSGAAGIMVVGDLPPPAAIDRNVYRIPNGLPAFKQGGPSYSWAAWRALGYEAGGYNIA